MLGRDFISRGMDTCQGSIPPATFFIIFVDFLPRLLAALHYTVRSATGEFGWLEVGVVGSLGGRVVGWVCG